jgi:predicted PurR-regulated permease PerM
MLLRTPMTDAAKYRLAAQILMTAALFGILGLHLLSALLSGLLIFQIVQTVVPALGRVGIRRTLSRSIALAVPAVIFGVAIVAAVGGLIALASGPDSLVTMLQGMADIIGTIRRQLPDWALPYLPSNLEDLQAGAAEMLRKHAGQLGTVGQRFSKGLFHIVLGLVIGSLLAIRVGTKSGRSPAPLAEEIEVRVARFAYAFRAVVFSQIRISVLNTSLTAVYLAILLPLFGVHLPFLKTMIAGTFLVGLIPILGNLISNTVIVVLALSVSPLVAATSLLFLILIHKLEYFMNARIIGGRINARAWELLMALLVMEAAFGIPGLIAAPIYYAYFKQELADEGLI